jgi:hypothetical protein
MNAAQHLGLKEMAQFEGVNPKTLQRRLERKHIILADDPEDARRKLVPVSAMSGRAYQSWMEVKAGAALQGVNVQAAASANTLQDLLPFATPSQKERALRDAVPLAIPKRFRPYVDRWSAIVGDCTNGTWQKFHDQSLEGVTVRSRGDFIRATAKLQGKGFSVASIHKTLKVLKEVNHNPDIPANQKMAEFWSRILPKNRPGRSGHSFFTDDANAWQREKLLSFYLTEAKCSARHAHRLLLNEIDAKQRAWGAGHLYQRPTLAMCRTILKDLDSPTVTFAREGPEAYRNKCSPYIKRRPPKTPAISL